jgi:hypothetical protein
LDRKANHWRLIVFLEQEYFFWSVIYSKTCLEFE